MKLKSDRIFGLDVLRAVAIVLVVLSHCTFLLFPNDNSIILDATRLFGAVGVDLFFVLSGYLIGGILLKQIANNQKQFKYLLTFWKRRWFRTLPNYFLVLLLNVLLLMILRKELNTETFSFIAFLQNFSTQHPDFFTEAWSLSIEEYAYLLLPLVLYLGFYLFKKANAKNTFLIVTLLTIISLFFLKINYVLNTEIDTYKAWSGTFRKVVIYRLDSIYLGFLLVYATRQFPNWFVNYSKQLLVLGVFIFGILHGSIFYFEVLPQTHLIFYTIFYLPILILSLGLVFPFATNMKYNGFFKPLVHYVSTRSYAIYLVNYSLVLLTIQHFIEVEGLSVVEKGCSLIGYLTLTLIISELIYKYFEQPILKFRDRKYRLQ